MPRLWWRPIRSALRSVHLLVYAPLHLPRDHCYPQQMSQYESPRLSQSGRVISGHYYAETAMDDLRDCTPNSLEFRLDEVNTKCTEMGFGSIFDVVLELTESKHQQWRQLLCRFAQSGGVTRLLTKCQQAGYFRSSANPVPNVGELGDDSDDSGDDMIDVHSSICNSAFHIYRSEWKKLTTDPWMRRPMSSFNERSIEEFSFGEIFLRMTELAPSLIRLVEGLTWSDRDLEVDLRKPGVTKAERRHRRKCRHIVMAVSILANASNRNINLVQGCLGFFLYAYRVPKRVYPILNHLGISISFDTVQKGLKALAADQRKTLKSLYTLGKGLQLSFDNMQKQRNVRYERQHNRGGMTTGTAGFVAEDSQNQQFTHTDVDYRAAKTMTIGELLPTTDDDDKIDLYIRYKVSKVFQNWCLENEIALPQDFIMKQPSVAPLNPKDSAKVHPLPVYPLDESRIDDTSKIYNCLADDLGIRPEDIISKKIHCKGDHMTVKNSRYHIPHHHRTKL